jgi:hypothetical protein
MTGAVATENCVHSSEVLEILWWSDEKTRHAVCFPQL